MHSLKMQKLIDFNQYSQIVQIKKIRKPMFLPSPILYRATPTMVFTYLNIYSCDER